MGTLVQDVVVVGGGAAGVHAALACREHYPDKLVTLVDEEGEIGYYRPLISMFMAGMLDEEKLFFWRPGEDPLLKVRLGATAASLDAEERRLELSNGGSLSYERLILAPGGHPVVPPGPRAGVFAVRSLAAARVIRDWLPEHRDVVILGAGLVGVKTAAHLAIFGFPSLLVEMEGHVLPNQLTPEAARPIETHLRNLGIEVRTGATVDATRAGETGDLEGVRIAGEWLACNTLLVAIGSTPDLGFLEGTGLLDDGELVVSPALMTRDDRVFAAGDAIAIQARDGTRAYPWTWPQAVAQGKLAGANVYRASPVPLDTLTRPNATNVAGLALVVLGAPTEGAEVIARPGLPDGVHRELFVSEGRIVGGALVGDISGAGPLRAMMAAGREVRGDVLDLLELRTRAFPELVWSRLAQGRRARSITATGRSA